MTFADERVPEPDDIAVIAVQGRFPGAGNVDELWENLKTGVESISTFSDAELRAAGIDTTYASVPGFVNRGCVLEEIDQFDAGFFGYSARDADTMDPQQRVFLEVAWECLERAGVNPDAYPGAIGVFAGCDQSTYLYQIYNNVDLSAYGYGGMMSIGNEKDYLTTQTSYRLNLRGPSLDVQTSCSTSLVAVCIACQNLRHGYCDMALAGGVAISTPQKTGYWYQPGGILSADGHCRPFDANAQGTVVGSGVGVAVLKRLSDALHDGDTVLAVIKGFGVNNDGAAKVGYTAPGIEGQSRAIEAAHRMGGIDAGTVGYIEAHGTATALGDPVEVAALTKAFRRTTDKTEFCGIGSLKSNVGHLSSAAGISGFIKTVLTVHHGEIPPSLHFTEPNPQLGLETTPFFVPSELTPWPVDGGARRAAVSSFGVGGTNAHLVLEQAPAGEPAADGRDEVLLVLSARTPSALEQATDNLVADLRARPDLDLADVAFTLQDGRKTFPHRRALVGSRAHREDLVATLEARDPARVSTTQSDIADRAVVFLFSGQGTQYVGMGADLYRTEPTFATELERCADLLVDQLGLDLLTLLYPEPEDGVSDPEAALRQTEMTQPALFALEYALARQWMEWGIRPRAMIGHSIGEYVAACLADVMSLEDALAVVAMRGRLMGSMAKGAMLAVGLPEAALQPVLGRDVSLAAVNAPAMSVVSGRDEAIAALEDQFSQQGIACQRLHTSHAFHSSLMEPAVAQFVERLRRVELRPPRMPYLSNLTGSWMTGELATSAEYWGHHLRQTVRFADNLAEVMAWPNLALLEIGPGQTLGFLARQQGSQASSQLILSSLPGAREKDRYSGSALMAWTLGQLWLGGVKVDWRGVHRHSPARHVVLPTYPFERQRYWLGPLETAPAPQTEAPAAVGQNGGSPSEAGALDLTGPAAAQAAPAAATRPSGEPDVGTWTSVPVWTPIVNPASEQHSERAAEPWLVFGGPDGLGDEVRAHLAEAGATVVQVVPGEAFEPGDDRFTLRPGESDDYGRLVDELQARGELPTRVLHLWSADGDDEGESAVEAFDRAQERSFYSVVFAARRLAKASHSKPVQMGVVTRRLQPVLGDEALRSAEATVLGACKVVSQEHPNVRCRAIDVAGEDGDAEALVRELAEEPFRAVVAYRRGRRWSEGYEATPLESGTAPIGGLADGDVVLVTGGLGNIALLLAETIAADVKARFVLTGRSEIPQRETWERHVDEHPSDPLSGKLRRLLELERGGSEVMVARADVVDAEQMRAVVAAATERWGAVHAVIHAAADLASDAFGPLAQLDRTTGDRHLAAKARGLLVVEDAVQGQPVKLVVLLSSLSSVLGGLGLGAYAAANAYLDAVARQRNQRGDAAWVTIDWDAWTFGPQAADGEAITPPLGQDCFRRIMRSSLRHVVVSTTPLGDRLSQWVELSALDGRRAADGHPVATNRDRPADVDPGGGDLHARPSLTTAYTAPRTETEQAIVGVWEQLLGVGPVGIHDKFFELGGHSLLAVQLMDRLREIFEVDVPVQRIFEAPTVAGLAEGIDADRGTAPAPAAAPPADLEDPSVEEALKLVESLSDEEVEALLGEAEALDADAGHG